MTAPGLDWQARTRRIAATILMLAIALYVAVDVLRSILPLLVITVVVLVPVLAVAAAIRARRARW